MSNWIKCSDRTPSDDRSVLICDGELIDVGFYICPDWYCDKEMSEISHWQELPALPEEE